MVDLKHNQDHLEKSFKRLKKKVKSDNRWYEDLDGKHIRKKNELGEPEPAYKTFLEETFEESTTPPRLSSYDVKKRSKNLKETREIVRTHCMLLSVMTTLMMGLLLWCFKEAYWIEHTGDDYSARGLPGPIKPFNMKGGEPISVADQDTPKPETATNEEEGAPEEEEDQEEEENQNGCCGCCGRCVLS